jgi:hypothetical protein
MDNPINQMLDTLIEVKVEQIKKIEGRMVSDQEVLDSYKLQLAEYEAQKAEANQ